MNLVAGLPGPDWPGLARPGLARTGLDCLGLSPRPGPDWTGPACLPTRPALSGAAALVAACAVMAVSTLA